MDFFQFSMDKKSNLKSLQLRDNDHSLITLPSNCVEHIIHQVCYCGTLMGGPPD